MDESDDEGSREEITSNARSNIRSDDIVTAMLEVRGCTSNSTPRAVHHRVKERTISEKDEWTSSASRECLPPPERRPAVVFDLRFSQLCEKKNYGELTLALPDRSRSAFCPPPTPPKILLSTPKSWRVNNPLSSISSVPGDFYGLHDVVSIAIGVHQ